VGPVGAAAGATFLGPGAHPDPVQSVGVSPPGRGAHFRHTCAVSLDFRPIVQ
jgi:hypothetical protein